MMKSSIATALWGGVHHFWQNKMLLDYTIELNDRKLKVHKIVMACVSDYFRAMFTGGMVESQTDSVKLKGLDPLTVSNIIEYIYTGRFGDPQASTEELLDCAMYLQIPAVVQVCSEVLRNSVKIENCIDILITFKTYSIEQGMEYTVGYIRSNMDELLQRCNLDEISEEKLQILIDCWGKSECQLFMTINEWVQVDFEKRNQHLNNLMSQVRFALMTPEQLKTIKKMEVYSGSESPWCNLVLKAEEYHSLPINLKVLRDSVQSEVRGDPTPLCFMAKENGETDSVFHAVEGTAWIQHKALNPPQFGYGPPTIITVNNYAIACQEREWHVFDPRTKSWTKMTAMPMEKSEFEIVHCNEQLFVLGGKIKSEYTNSIEKYDFETDTWSVVDSKIPVLLEYYNACSLGGSIYVINAFELVTGSMLSEGKVSTRMDCFKPSTNTWNTKAPIPETFYSGYTIQVMELDKEEVIFLLVSCFYMQYYSGSTNQWSVFNPVVGANPLMFLYPPSTVLPYRNTLFLCNFLHEIEHVPGHMLVNEENTDGACEMWTLPGKWQQTITKKLDDIPDVRDKNDEYRDYFLALLAIAP